MKSNPAKKSDTKLSKFSELPSTSLYREIPFILFTLALPAVTLIALSYPPVLVSQGQAHRIFYIHVPVAWVALYAPLFAALSGIAYLVTRKDRFDVWSAANVRLAFLFALGVVITGPLWAKTEWGTFWNWKDSRLITFFVLLLCLGGYFIVRYLTDNPRQRPVYGAFMAIIAALASGLTWFAIRLIEPDTHPGSVLGSMHPSIGRTFWISVIGYHLIFWSMLRLAVRHESLSRLRERIMQERDT